MRVGERSLEFEESLGVQEYLAWQRNVSEPGIHTLIPRQDFRISKEALTRSSRLPAEQTVGLTPAKPLGMRGLCFRIARGAAAKKTTAIPLTPSPPAVSRAPVGQKRVWSRRVSSRMLSKHPQIANRTAETFELRRRFYSAWSNLRLAV